MVTATSNNDKADATKHTKYIKNVFKKSIHLSTLRCSSFIMVYILIEEVELTAVTGDEFRKERGKL